MRRILSALLVGTLVSPAAAQQPPTVVRSRTAVTTDSTMVQGHALSAANAPLRRMHVRLRDVRLGRIVDEAVTDDEGFFRFAGVDPGSYIIELIGNDKTVLAASQLVTPNAGDEVSVIVKLPLRTVAGTLLNRATPALVAVAAAAAGAGLLASTVTGQPISPVR
jgi:hypothetical protein